MRLISAHCSAPTTPSSSPDHHDQARFRTRPDDYRPRAGWVNFEPAQVDHYSPGAHKGSLRRKRDIHRTPARQLHASLNASPQLLVRHRSDALLWSTGCRHEFSWFEGPRPADRAGPERKRTSRAASAGAGTGLVVGLVGQELRPLGVREVAADVARRRVAGGRRGSWLQRIGSHSRMVPSSPALASWSPRGLNATALTQPVWASSGRPSARRVGTSHSRTVWSAPAEASVLPSGLKAERADDVGVAGQRRAERAAGRRRPRARPSRRRRRWPGCGRPGVNATASTKPVGPRSGGRAGGGRRRPTAGPCRPGRRRPGSCRPGRRPRR